MLRSVLRSIGEAGARNEQQDAASSDERIHGICRQNMLVEKRTDGPFKS